MISLSYDIFEVGDQPPVCFIWRFHLSVLNIWTGERQRAVHLRSGLANIFGQRKQLMVLDIRYCRYGAVMVHGHNTNILNCTPPPVGIALRWFLANREYTTITEINWKRRTGLVVIGVSMGAVVAKSGSVGIHQWYDCRCAIWSAGIWRVIENQNPDNRASKLNLPDLVV